MSESDLIERNLTSEVIQIPEFGQVKIVEATNTEGCVDPRQSVTFIQPEGVLAEALGHSAQVKREPHHDGSERSPGASFGKAMSLAAAMPQLTPQQAVDIVKEWEESEGRTFTFHEDNHTHHGSLGCGHIDRASLKENEDLYGLPSDKVISMKKYLVEKTNQGHMVAEVPMLTNSHREKAVLVVLSEDSTVMATDGNEEFFRFDALRHEKSLERLAAFAQSKGVEVSTDRLKEEAQKQRIATLTLLAENLPIYEIDLQSPYPSVIARGNVPPRNVERQNIAA